MLAAELLHNLWRENAGGESSPEDSIELGVQATDSHLGEVPVRVNDALPLDFALALAREEDRGPLSLLEGHGRVREAEADGGLDRLASSAATLHRGKVASLDVSNRHLESRMGSINYFSSAIGKL